MTPNLAPWRSRLGRTSSGLALISLAWLVLLPVLKANLPTRTPPADFLFNHYGELAFPAFVLMALGLIGAIIAWPGPRRIVLSGIGLLGVLAALIVPGLLRACCEGNEASAIGSLRAINSAQASYSSSCAAGGYATDLADLNLPPPGSSQGFISPTLNANGVVRNEYVFSLARDNAPDTTSIGSAARTCNGSKAQPVSAYFASANPVTPRGFARYFATDARGTIFFSTDGPVRNPIPPAANVVQ